MPCLEDSISWRIFCQASVCSVFYVVTCLGILEQEQELAPWACHMQLTALWKTLVFNCSFLPISCSHLTSPALRLSRPFKTFCLAVKAFEFLSMKNVFSQVTDLNIMEMFDSHGYAL